MPEELPPEPSEEEFADWLPPAIAMAMLAPHLSHDGAVKEVLDRLRDDRIRAAGSTSYRIHGNITKDERCPIMPSWWNDAALSASDRFWRTGTVTFMRPSTRNAMGVTNVTFYGVKLDREDIYQIFDASGLPRPPTPTKPKVRPHVDALFAENQRRWAPIDIENVLDQLEKKLASEGGEKPKNTRSPPPLPASTAKSVPAPPAPSDVVPNERVEEDFVRRVAPEVFEPASQPGPVTSPQKARANRAGRVTDTRLKAWYEKHHAKFPSHVHHQVKRAAEAKFSPLEVGKNQLYRVMRGVQGGLRIGNPRISRHRSGN